MVQVLGQEMELGMQVQRFIILGSITLIAVLGCTDARNQNAATQPGAKTPALSFAESCRRTPVVPTAVRPVPPALPARDADVLEAALRDLLRDADRGHTFFIAILKWDNTREDPPADFLHRLDDLQLQLKPMSAARFPKSGLIGNRGLEEPSIEERPTIYWVGIEERISDTEVRVNTGHSSGPLSGGWNIKIYELRDGHWVFNKTVSRGISSRWLRSDHRG